MEMTLKQRLENIIKKLETKSSDDWIEAQRHNKVIHYYLIGWSGGSKNAISIIRDEFHDILGDQPEISQNDPIEPLHYIDSNNILFRDKHGRFYFWDELYQYAHGPYGSNIEACEALRSYGKELDNGTISEPLGIDNNSKSRSSMIVEEE